MKLKNEIKNPETSVDYHKISHTQRINILVVLKYKTSKEFFKIRMKLKQE